MIRSKLFFAFRMIDNEFHWKIPLFVLLRWVTQQIGRKRICFVSCDYLVLYIKLSRVRRRKERRVKWKHCYFVFSSIYFRRSNLILLCPMSSRFLRVFFFLYWYPSIDFSSNAYTDEILSTQRSCTPTSNNKSFASPSSSSPPLFSFYERTRERERKRWTLNKSAQLSSFVPRLFFLLSFSVISNIHHHPSLLLRLFFTSQSLVICSASFVECSSHNYKHSSSSSSSSSCNLPRKKTQQTNGVNWFDIRWVVSFFSSLFCYFYQAGAIIPWGIDVSAVYFHRTRISFF